MRTGPNAGTLRCINVQADARRFTSLEAATQEFTPDFVLKNIKSTFVDAIPQILNDIGGAAFFFVDPLRTKDIPFADLLHLAVASDR